MGLLKKKKDEVKPFKVRSVSGGGSPSEVSPLRPQAVEKLPPCTGHCPSGNDIRGWLTTIAQREKIGLSLEEACTRYTLTVEEFLSWQQSIDEHGLAGLRTTRIQQYRQ